MPVPSVPALQRKARRAVERARHPRWVKVWADRRGVCPPEGKGWNFAVRRWLRATAGVDVHRHRDPSAVRLTRSTLDLEVDPAFSALVDEAVARSGGGPAGHGPGATRHRQRLYQLLELLDQTRGVPGVVVECGTYRGLTAYLACRRLRDEDAAFSGKGFHVFDSFEGISAPGVEDRAGDPAIPSGKARAAGMFAAGQDVVRATLDGFPDVALHPGWIPESLAGAPDGPVRFVHLDLDVFEPTRAALAFFHPRLSPGGLIVVDDYGTVRWPGATAAVDDYCASTGARRLRLATGQAVVFSTGVSNTGVFSTGVFSPAP